MTSPSIDELFQAAAGQLQAGRLAEAETLCRRALELQPDHADAQQLAGLVAFQAGQLPLAAERLARAAALRPDHAGYQNNLGEVCRRLGRLDQAIAAYQRGLAAAPGAAPIYSNLALALVAAGRVDEAIAACLKGLALAPQDPQALDNLACILADHAASRDVAAIYAQALGSHPQAAEMLGNFSLKLQGRQAHDQAIAASRRALALRPNLAGAYTNLGTAFLRIGWPAEAIDAFGRSVAGQFHVPDVHSNLLLALNYLHDADPQQVLAEHRRWNQLYAAPLRAAAPAPADPRPDRPLRIGLVSSDLRDNVLSRFLLSVLACRDRAAFGLVAYANHVSPPDAVSDQIAGFCDTCRRIETLADAQVADLIRQDRIDILIDLDGHTAYNRLLIFARRPAPIQVSYLGYPNTTGMPAIDYRLTDPIADPPGMTEPLYTETLLRLPRTAWCLAEPDEAPPVPEPPSAGEPITFGCFNNLPKLTEPQLRLWAQILASVPGSRLLIKAAGTTSALARERIVGTLGSAGIDPSRVSFHAMLPRHADHLALYGQIDVALDTYPYHGTTTTCEALYMGVPVVTCAGSTHASRVGVSLLTNAGLPDLIAQSPEDYVQIACRLAADRDRCAALRRGLRDQLRRSPLMDAPAFMRDLEAALRIMWQRRCAAADTR